MEVNGEWSGITMSYWQTEDCGRVSKWSLTHLHLLLPGLSCHSFPIPNFFLAWSCPREVQGQLLNGTKWSLKSEESLRMPYPAKRMSCVLEKEAQCHQQKKKMEVMPSLSFGVQAALVLFFLPLHNGTGSLKCFYYCWKCWAWTWEAWDNGGTTEQKLWMLTPSELPKLVMNNVRIAPVLFLPMCRNFNEFSANVVSENICCQLYFHGVEWENLKSAIKVKLLPISLLRWLLPSINAHKMKRSLFLGRTIAVNLSVQDADVAARAPLHPPCRCHSVGMIFTPPVTNKPWECCCWGTQSAAG